MKRVLGGLGLGLALVFLSTATAEAAPADNLGASPSAINGLGGLGGVGSLVGGLTGGAGTLGSLLPSSNGSGGNLVSGLMNHPAGAITGAPGSILPHGLLDGGKTLPLLSK